MSSVVDWRSIIASAVVCLSCSSGGTTPAAGPGVIIGSAGSAGGGGGAAGGATPAGGAGNGGVAGGVSGGSGAAGSAGTAPSRAGSGGEAPLDDTASKTALEQLEAWLAQPVAARPALSEQAFALVALTKADAGTARQRLVSDYTAQLKATRAGEMGATESQAKTITAGGVSMKYYRAERGKKPAGGWNLFISMHGGGDADKATNDSQWDNQLALVDGYEPKDAIWIAPRAPTDEWNMWFREHMDALFERLIANFVAFEGVDPNHVYLNGYSAGGDGAYQMGPRMADAWAGVGMSAGHPNDASPLSLRNTAFAIHVGGDDTSFDRNKKAAEWGMKLDELGAADSGGYVHQWQVHAGLPHWMDLEDAVSIPFMQQHARDPIAHKVVWRQQKALRSSFYWLAVDAADTKAESELTASYAGQTLSIDSAQGVKSVALRVSDAMVDQDRPITVKYGAKELFSGNVSRTIAVLYRTLQGRGDPSLMFAGEVRVTLD
jgi:poly(3-hydroxybutyrate) depolymerase